MWLGQLHPLMRHDRRLLIRVRDGQLDALAGLFDRHAQHCVARALKVHGDQALADAAVFEAFMQLWRDPPAKQTSIRAWLSTRAEQIAQLAADCISSKRANHDQAHWHSDRDRHRYRYRYRRRSSRASRAPAHVIHRRPGSALAIYAPRFTQPRLAQQNAPHRSVWQRAPNLPNTGVGAT
jgi:DNA-directed RNA polymerase specialized sigma24 family protein